MDDSPTILDEMHRFLNHEEYEVTKIDDPVKAAAVLFKLKPDLVLMDITMPEINGYKLCSLLRNSVALRGNSHRHGDGAGQGWWIRLGPG